MENLFRIDINFRNEVKEKDKCFNQSFENPKIILLVKIWEIDEVQKKPQ